jgi:hypothetical protein
VRIASDAIGLDAVEGLGVAFDFVVHIPAPGKDDVAYLTLKPVVAPGDGFDAVADFIWWSVRNIV